MLLMFKFHKTWPFFFVSVYLTNVQKEGDFLLLIHVPEMYDLTDASTYTFIPFHHHVYLQENVL